MSKAVKFTKDYIIEVAVQTLREEGPGALTCRNIASRMGCSISPIFRTYANMDEVLKDIRAAADKIFLDFMDDVLMYTPAFKELGLRIVRFAKREPRLFYFLFLENGGRYELADSIAKECLKQSEEHFGLTPEQSAIIHSQLWPYVSGIGVLSHKKPEAYPEEEVSRMLSTQFYALLLLLKSGKEVEDIKPQKTAI